MTDDLTHAIRHTCMLATIRTTALGLNRTDRSASRDVEKTAGAVNGAARVIVSRLPGADEHHKVILKAQDAVKDALHRLSMPYGNDPGWRLLPNANFDALSTAFVNFNVAFREAMTALEADAPNIIARARANMGSLDVPVPTVEELVNAYSLTPEFREIPEGTFPGMPPQTAEKLRRHTSRKLQEAVENAMSDTLERFVQPLAYFVERMDLFDQREAALAKGEEVGRNGVFRDSVVTNLKELVAVVDSFNVTGDARLSDISARLSKFTEIEPDALRENQPLRAEAKQTAANALSALQEWLAPLDTLEGKAA